MTTAEVLKNLRRGNSVQIIETLLQRFKDEIGPSSQPWSSGLWLMFISEALEIDRIEGLRRLPDSRGASWDSNKACLPTPRIVHRREIKSWIDMSTQRFSAELLLIADGMGSGKTSLAHSICQQAQKDGCLVACFFFSRLRAEESTSRHFFGSLIRGLCRLNRTVRDEIALILQKDDSLAVAPPSRQLQEIILPICRVLPRKVPLFVVIDALDEDPDTELLTILQDGISLLPSNLCLIATTRPEAGIMSRLEGRSHVRRLPFSLVQGKDTLQDIHRHIQERLRNPPFQETIFSNKLVKDFVDRSEGVFLWAEVILAYLEDSLYRDKDLQDIIASPQGAQSHPDAEAKLDDLYGQILMKLRWSDERLARAYKTFMGAIVTSKEPISLKALAALYAHDRIGRRNSEASSLTARQLLP
ncbi:hypothetical protein EST38_g11342 [Candolleomyces aberdarensis]|uniref:Nephrocystin 3-like N-terminal domain-containing protein n=1 Tax=Candolleomyces aberdarensis TaxID=2316362 RepID=A0A4Q2D6L6_9AGAR|nr:hypothetical protein EST38_g11342 [Candolleomyces aberdarensis]